jgi:hypothetical protein
MDRSLPMLRTSPGPLPSIQWLTLCAQSRPGAACSREGEDYAAVA